MTLLLRRGLGDLLRVALRQIPSSTALPSVKERLPNGDSVQPWCDTLLVKLARVVLDDGQRNLLHDIFHCIPLAQPSENHGSQPGSVVRQDFLPVDLLTAVRAPGRRAADFDGLSDLAGIQVAHCSISCRYGCFLADAARYFWRILAVRRELLPCSPALRPGLPPFIIGRRPESVPSGRTC